MNAPKFSDRFGREWHVEVSVDLLPALAAAGIDLIRPDPVKLLGFIAESDPLSLGESLWIFCAAQAKDRGIDHVQFARGLNADALASGGDALMFAVNGYLAMQALKSAEQRERERIASELNAVRAKYGLPPLNPDGTRPKE